MTAAVARPPLFTHLVASRPNRDAGSLKATIISVILHALLILAAVYATQQVRKPAPVREIVRPILPPLAVDAPAAAQSTAPSRGGGPSIAAPALPAPPSGLPLPGAPPVDPWRDLDHIITPTPPPPGRSPGGTGPGNPEASGPHFTPYTVAPQLLNRAEVSRLLIRLYPPMLLNAGIGGTVVTWIQIDENGRVIDRRVSRSSGHDALDEAALKVAEAMRFSPAYNREAKVPVWVELPIVFTAR